MAISPSSLSMNSLMAAQKPGYCKNNQNYQKLIEINKFKFVKVKAAADKDQSTKPNSVICADCDGNGAVVCSQCKGNGVNSLDFFDGTFKAGDSCWLCGGKKDMLCGNCNGAGFLGGFMTSSDT